MNRYLLDTPARAYPAPPFKVIIVDLRDREQRAWAGARMRELEADISYPLGPGKWFKIDHGEDYFAFFERLGKPFKCI